MLQIAADRLPQGRIEICRSVAALDARLHRPTDDMAIAIFHVGDRDELEALIARRELLSDFKIVLALPDAAEGTTARGHLLRPRFVIYSEGDLRNASSILGKMVQGAKSAAARPATGHEKVKRKVWEKSSSAAVPCR
ncbi:MAG: hypothetical protein M0009_11310 [Deltaproteobacteria bacterium]|nr:hypothetical protein [Deltaproteobacteria bacterium]